MQMQRVSKRVRRRTVRPLGDEFCTAELIFATLDYMDAKDSRRAAIENRHGGSSPSKARSHKKKCGNPNDCTLAAPAEYSPQHAAVINPPNAAASGDAEAAGHEEIWVSGVKGIPVLVTVTAYPQVFAAWKHCSNKSWW